jgi:hypothetical protein
MERIHPDKDAVDVEANEAAEKAAKSLANKAKWKAAITAAKWAAANKNKSSFAKESASSAPKEREERKEEGDSCTPKPENGVAATSNSSPITPIQQTEGKNQLIVQVPKKMKPAFGGAKWKAAITATIVENDLVKDSSDLSDATNTLGEERRTSVATWKRRTSLEGSESELQAIILC